MRVAIAITVFNKPERLAGLLDNMKWAGIPPIPVYVFEDPTPTNAGLEIMQRFVELCEHRNVQYNRALEWGHMHGIIDYAMRNTDEDWIIYVPDDVRFTRGGLWQEYANVLAYGQYSFVGAIQAPYWNADDLVTMGCMPYKDAMYHGWQPEGVPRNPFWDMRGVPRKYVNVNGAGFSLSRQQFNSMGGWPRCTWRLDEWIGWTTWTSGRVCITSPGPPRVHYMGGSTGIAPDGTDYASVDAWKEATGGRSPIETGNVTFEIMDQLPEEDFDGIYRFFAEGNTLRVPTVQDWRTQRLGGHQLDVQQAVSSWAS